MSNAVDPETTKRTPRRRRGSFARAIRALVLWSAAWWAVLGLVIHPAVPGGWITIGTVAILTLVVPLLVFHRAMTGRLYPGAAIRLLVFRPFWYVQLGIPVLGAAGALGALAGLLAPGAGAGGGYAVLGAAALLAAVAVAGWVGSRLLVTRRMDAVFPDLPEGLEGLRIVQVSDLHVGPHTSRWHLARVAGAIEAADADVIVFTGDQVDDYPRDTAPFARAFAALEAPLGVYAIAGNHDIYAGWTPVRRGLEAAGQRVLVNEAVELRRHGASLWLAGVGDPAGRGFRGGGAAEAVPDIERTLASVPEGGFVVALAHNPVLWPALAEHGVPLTLSGHTHHGQFSVPRLDWSLASAFLEHAHGSHRRGRSLLYINPGTNYWGLPFRLGALPEVTVVELRRGEGPGLAERG